MSEHGLGCLHEKVDIRDYKLKRKVAMSVEFPPTYICEGYRNVKSQGSVGSCVAHATTEILEFHNGGQRLSTNFIYGIHKKLYATPGPGMYLREACKIVREYGDPVYDLCPGNTEVSKVYEIAEEAFAKNEVLQNAAKYRIDSFAKLNSISDIKYALLNYGPVLSSVDWYSDNRVINGVLTQAGEKSGGHAIMLYGWNEQGWLMQNSWGKSWGKGGCCILPYDYKLTGTYSFVPASSMDTDVVIPARNKIVEVIFGIINSILNLFIKHD